MRVLPPILFIFLMFFSCVQQTVEELENNDNFSEAQSLNIPAHLTGSLSSSDDKDYYTIKMSGDGLLDFFLTPGGNDNLSLTLFDEHRRPLKTINDQGPGANEQFFNFLQTKERTIYLKVEKIIETTPGLSTPDPSYILEVLEKEKEGFESEPNNSLQKATAAEANAMVKGTLNTWHQKGFSRKGETDFFKIPVEQEGLFSLFINLDTEGPGDGRIEVFDFRGQPLVDVDEYGPGQGENYRNIGIEGPGEFYLKISGSNSFIYELFNEILPRDSEQECEPNSSLALSTPVQEGQTEIFGTLRGSNDIDVFQLNFSYPEGKVLNIVLEPEEESLVELTLLDAGGRTLARSKSFQQMISLANIMVYENDLFIKTAMLSPFTARSQDYRLGLYFRNYQEGLEKEPNNESSLANAMKTEEHITGYISYEEDYDYYQFNIFSGGEYSFDLTPPGKSFIQWTLYDQERQPVYSNSNTVSYPVDLDRGTWFLELKAGKSNEHLNLLAREPYRLYVRPEF